MRQSKHISDTSIGGWIPVGSKPQANRRLKRGVVAAGCQRESACGIMSGRVLVDEKE